MLSNCYYNTLSGTSVARDFVEMPSQFNESFASIPEVFNNYAKHYKTNQPMPAELRDKMLKSVNFQAAYALGENLAATCLDMAWHMLPADKVPTADKAKDFETKALKKLDCSTIRFLHATQPLTSTTYGAVAMQQVTTATFGQKFSQSTLPITSQHTVR